MASLSVISCNYNHGDLVGRMLNTVVTQSRPPDELVIIEDGSTDNSKEVIRPFVQKYPFIRYFENESNKGLFFSWQRGMSLIRGDYLCGAASDDCFLPGFYEQAMRMAEQHPHVGEIFGQFFYVTPQGQYRGIHKILNYETPGEVPRDVLQKYFDLEMIPGGAAGTIMKRSAFEAVGGFRPELSSWCDVFATRAIALRYGACYIPRPVAKFSLMERGFSQSLAADPEKVREMVRRVVDLMRSDEFRDIHSEQFINRWQYFMAEHYCQKFNPDSHVTIPRDLRQIREAYVHWSTWDSPLDKVLSMMVATPFWLLDHLKLREFLSKLWSLKLEAAARLKRPPKSDVNG